MRKSKLFSIIVVIKVIGIIIINYYQIYLFSSKQCQKFGACNS